MSTTSLLQHYPDETILLQSNALTLNGVSSDPSCRPVSAPVSSINNLPVSFIYDLNKEESSDNQLGQASLSNDALYVTTVALNNINLSRVQKVLLQWHQRLGHLAFKKIQLLLRSGVLSHTSESRQLHIAAAAVEPMPLCTACRFAKQTQRGNGGR